MKWEKIALGCGIAALVAIVLCALVAYFGGRAFFTFGVGSDLSDYRDAIEATQLDETTKKRLLDDLEEIRISLDDGNHFGFFQWIEMDNSIQGLIVDHKVNTRELEALRTEIARMRKIQGLKDQDLNP